MASAKSSRETVLLSNAAKFSDTKSRSPENCGDLQAQPVQSGISKPYSRIAPHRMFAPNTLAATSSAACRRAGLHLLP